MKKVTKATLKSFINKNKNNLYIKIFRKFDGMIDGLTSENGNFIKAEETNININETLGIKDILLVNFKGRGQDCYYKYEDEEFKGIRVSNCCKEFVCAIKNN